MASKKTIKNGIILQHEFLNQTRALSDEQFGRVIRALVDYDLTGDVPNFDNETILLMAFDLVKTTLDAEKKRYSDICNKNKQNAEKRWNLQKTEVMRPHATAYDRIRPHATASNEPAYSSNIYNNSFNISNSSFNRLPIVYTRNKHISMYRVYTSNHKANTSSLNISMYRVYTSKQRKKESEKEKKKYLRLTAPVGQTSLTDTNPLGEGKFLLGKQSVRGAVAQSNKEKKIKEFLSLSFAKTWLLYPRKVGKEQAKKTWDKKLRSLKTEEAVASKARKIYALLVKHIDSWKTEKNGDGSIGRAKQYIPHFSTWLNDNIPDKGE